MTEVRTEIEDLIPHRDRMKLVDRLQDTDDGSATTLATVTDGWPLCRQGHVETVVMLELIAQSVAVVQGWQDRDTREPGMPGLLVGIRKATLMTSHVPVGTTLTVRVKTLNASRNYAVFAGTVRDDTAVICEAEIQVYHPGSDLKELTEARTG